MNTAEILNSRLTRLRQDIIERTLSLMPSHNVESEPIWIKFNTPVQVGNLGHIESIKRIGNQLFLVYQEDEADQPIDDFDDIGTLVFIVEQLEKADIGQKYNDIYEIITLED